MNILLVANNKEIIPWTDFPLWKVQKGEGVCERKKPLLFMFYEEQVTASFSYYL